MLRYVEIMHVLFQYHLLHRAEHLLPESKAVLFCGAPCIGSQKNISARNMCSQENSAMVQPTLSETYEPPKHKGEKT